MLMLPFVVNEALDTSVFLASISASVNPRVNADASVRKDREIGEESCITGGLNITKSIHPATL